MRGLPPLAPDTPMSSAFGTETVLDVRHWTDDYFSFTTTRDDGFRFENGQFVMREKIRSRVARYSRESRSRGLGRSTGTTSWTVAGRRLMVVSPIFARTHPRVSRPGLTLRVSGGLCKRGGHESRANVSP